MEIVLVIALPGVEKKTPFLLYINDTKMEKMVPFLQSVSREKNIVYDKDFQSLSRIVCPKKKKNDTIRV